MNVKRDNNDAGLAAREQLIQTGLDLFGQLGYSTVTVRQICDAACMNVASVNYHFGNKEGLYLAVADYIQDNLNQRLQPLKPSITAFLKTENKDKSLALEHLLTVCDLLADILIPDSVETERWARFITRFQLGDEVPNHKLSKHAAYELLTQLVACLRDNQDDHFTNAAIAITIFGQILVFRANRISAKHSLQVKKIGAQQTQQLKNIIRCNVTTMFGEIDS